MCFSISLSWPVVQFIQSEYLVCEDVHSFNIAIKRTGNLQQSCSVQVKIKSMTAKVKDDFMVEGDKTVWFGPGRSEIKGYVGRRVCTCEVGKQGFSWIGIQRALIV